MLHEGVKFRVLPLYILFLELAMLPTNIVSDILEELGIPFYTTVSPPHIPAYIFAFGGSDVMRP